MSIKVTDHYSVPGEDLICLEKLRKEGHAQCMAFLHPSLKLNFSLESPRVLIAEADFTEEMISFNGMVHGGLQAFLIDQAMTCALMGLGVFGATCELNLRYRTSVQVGVPAVIRVWIEKRYRKLYALKAELIQNEKCCTEASARFFKQILNNNMNSPNE